MTTKDGNSDAPTIVPGDTVSDGDRAADADESDGIGSSVEEQKASAAERADAQRLADASPGGYGEWSDGLDREREVLSLLRDAADGAEDNPEGRYDAVWSRIDARTAPASGSRAVARRGRRTRWLALAAAAVVMIVGVAVLTEGDAPPSEIPIPLRTRAVELLAKEAPTPKARGARLDALQDLADAARARLLAGGQDG